MYIKTLSPGPQSVNFISMTCGRTPVRRLSTASSVTKPPNFILTTEWLWYWKNDQGEWTEYGQGVSGLYLFILVIWGFFLKKSCYCLQMDAKHATPLTSQTLENVYQADPHSEIPVCSEKHTYVLSLKGTLLSENYLSVTVLLQL